jgi:preprotein translocase subunit SecD
MNPNLKWKALFILVVILACIYGLVGQPAFPTSIAQVKQNLEQRIKLGLDLQGGTHMILQVQVQEAIGLNCDTTIERLRRQMGDGSITFEEIRRLDEQHILVRNLNPDQVGAFRDLIRDSFADWDLAPAEGEVSGYRLTVKPSVVAAIRTDTLRQSVETIRRRVDALGLIEPIVAEHGRGENEILVQLPGEGDPTRAKKVIQAGGQLELRRVVSDRPFNSEAEAFASYGGKLPEGTELMRGRAEDREPGSTSGPFEVWYVLDRAPVVTGRDLPPGSIKVQPSSESPGRYEVGFGLYKAAATRFGNFTEQNIGRPMAIVLDRKVETAPTIQSRIEDSGRITGRFTLEKANELALILRAGALPASIKYLEERTIGPSLGADSIRQGIQASVISLIAVMAFMLFYYRLSGVNAVVALVLNLVILLAAMAYFGAAFTLPGIAGVILTIGMGVDSNVLVFERIREELRAGKANASAVDAGFDRAFLTIIDTHVTTIVSCAFLFIFGTGPVQGFAVTLVLGLLSNLFTAVYVSRTIFGWHLGRMSRQEALSI